MQIEKPVHVYVTSTCLHCRRVKAFLIENGVEFEEFDVFQDQNARKEMIDKSGQMGVPVLVIGDDVVIGFDPVAISNRLKLKK